MIDKSIGGEATNLISRGVQVRNISATLVTTNIMYSKPMAQEGRGQSNVLLRVSLGQAFDIPEGSVVYTLTSSVQPLFKEDK